MFSVFLNYFCYKIKLKIYTSIMKPFLKWVGGKTQIIDKVLEKMPNEIHGDYYEPFLGGGSVLLSVLSNIKIHGIVHASDYNLPLINLYKTIQTSTTEFIEKLQDIVNVYNSCDTSGVINRKATSLEESKTSKESYYYYIRKCYNETANDTIMKSVYFLFLNKTCFRGVYREGPRGFNVPYGHNKNVSVFNSKHIYDIAALIKNVVFTHVSFENSICNCKVQDFVYVDPPYAPENKTSFVSYIKDGFNLECHNTLFDMIKTLPCKWLMSNASVPLIHESFHNFIIESISVRRAINSNNPASIAKEVFISSN